jgi:hypothetical protein
MPDLSVLFLRDFKGLTGGELKVFEYFLTLSQIPALDARIYFTDRSRMDDTNPWRDHRSRILKHPVKADIYFLAGMDWEMLDRFRLPRDGRLVFNLIQHFRHTYSDDPRSQYLGRFAHRICVSQSLAEAVVATGRANGPVTAIPNGTDLAALRHFRREKSIDLFVAGAKNPAQAQAFAERLARGGRSIDLAAGYVGRPEYLRRIAQARMAIFFPFPDEGFFLPALEAMALETAVIVPD